jgi:hypothetical protein
MAVDWDAVVLGPVMGVFGEDEIVGLPNYRPVNGVPFDLADAVFDEAYMSLDPNDDGPAINTVSPVLGVRLALFPSPPIQGDQVYIPRVGQTFKVKDVRPDGHGSAKLMLNFVSQP